ncbi:metallophosphoesterase [Aminobacter niigataensis]
MRLWILSDLHLEIANLPGPLHVPAADVCVVAGDLCNGIDRGVQWLEQHIAPCMPCIYVGGNHEFYRGAIIEGIAAGKVAASQTRRVHFLQNETVELDGVCFVGATLWTDFRLAGHQALAMSHAQERMNDFRKIAYRRAPWARFRPAAAVGLHSESRRFIEDSLASRSSPVVVVTHHAPLRQSLPNPDSNDLLGAAYASDMSAILEMKSPNLWIHGHIHQSCDYIHSTTRVVCNPRGYNSENKQFDWKLVIDL